jgi:hypothetical protein
MKYEIINPSDKCYISSENERVAKYACLLIGNGKYGLHNAETGGSVLSIYLFGISDEEILAEFGEPLNDFFEHYKKEIAECINTFEYAGERTSLNNIGLTAKHLYNAIMKQLDRPTE